MVQAVNGVGLVSLDDNLGRTFSKSDIRDQPDGHDRRASYQDARRSRLHGDGGRLIWACR